MKKIFFSLIFVLCLSPFMTAQMKPVEVSINSNPSGASVSIEGQGVIGNTPFSARFTKGKTYSLVFSKSGYKTLNYSYKCDGSAINVTLQPDIVYYNLSVSSNPSGAQVTVNNKTYGNTPLNISLASGNYNVLIRVNGYKDYSTSVSLTSNKNVNVTLEPLYYVNLYVPKGANIYVDGQKINVNWGRSTWETVKINSPGGQTATIKVDYHGISVQQKVTFNRQTVKFSVGLQ